MKKFLSTFLALTLLLGMAVPFATPASAVSYTGSSASGTAGVSTGVSTGTTSIGNTIQMSSKATKDTVSNMVRENVTLTGVHLKVYGFDTGSRTVRVEIGNSKFYCPVTHYRSGGQIISTIKFCSQKNSNLLFGLGSPYDTVNGGVGILIKISHYGSSVPTHSFKINGNMAISAVLAPGSQAAASCTALQGSSHRGYYTTNVTIDACDNSTTKYISQWAYNRMRSGLSVNTGRSIGSSYSVSK